VAGCRALILVALAAAPAAGHPAKPDEEAARCAKSVGVVHARIGSLRFEAGNFAGAEASARTAVALDPSASNKLALLMALIREKKPEADALYAELARYDGDRDEGMREALNEAVARKR
jgi:hypothetical protein